MILKVNNEELNYFTKNMNNDSEDLDKEIDNMISLVNSLEAIWQGVDSTTFRDNMLSYLKKAKKIPVALNTLSTITERLNKGYDEKNEAFSRTLREVKNKYGR